MNINFQNKKRAPTALIAITTIAQLEELIQKNKVVVIDFWGAWCEPCKQMEPVMDALSLEYKDKAPFAKLNIDRHRDMLKKYHVRSIPTLVLLKNGKVEDKIVGVVKDKVVRDKLNRLLGIESKDTNLNNEKQ